jgi:hypothetical protein
VFDNTIFYYILIFSPSSSILNTKGVSVIFACIATEYFNKL